MSKRNFILLIIGLIILTGVIFSVIYSSKSKNANTTETTGTNFLASFNPFKKSAPAENKPADNTIDLSGEVPTSAEEQASTEKLQKVSNMPVAGFGIFMKERFKEVPVVVPTSTQPESTSSGPTPTPLKKEPVKPTPPPTEFIPSVRYAARTTGNVYQTFADKIDERQFTTTTIPRVHEAYFGNKGQSVVMRYLKEDGKTIETFVGALPKEVLGGDIMGDTELRGSFLPENISDMSLSPDTLKLFYLFNSEDHAFGITSLALGEKKVQVFSSPFTEWLTSWPSSEMITLTTKPSFNVPGYMYTINPNKKDLAKVLGNINGLTTLTSPDGKMILYGDNSLSLNIYNATTGTSVSTGARTLPEKCTWNKASTYIYCSVPRDIPGSQYPDSWYQGIVSFSDDLWKIDALNGNAMMIAELASNSQAQDVDGIKLAVDENESYLFFINKTDSFLWRLSLK